MTFVNRRSHVYQFPFFQGTQLFCVAARSRCRYRRSDGRRDGHGTVALDVRHSHGLPVDAPTARAQGIAVDVLEESPCGRLNAPVAAARGVR
jgi:hypothetical protein